MMYHNNNETVKRKRCDRMVIKAISNCLGKDLLMKRKLNMPEVNNVGGNKWLKEVCL